MSILDKFLKTLFGDRNERVLKKMLPTIERINSYEPEYENLTDEQLRDKTAEFRKRLSQHPRSSPWFWCWMTCTGPTNLPFYFYSSLLGSWATAGCSWLVLIGMWS